MPAPRRAFLFGETFWSTGITGASHFSNRLALALVSSSEITISLRYISFPGTHYHICLSTFSLNTLCFSSKSDIAFPKFGTSLAINIIGIDLLELNKSF